MTAEKLMHELNQKCGIDFNNARKALAVEIINEALTFSRVVIVENKLKISPDSPLAMVGIDGISKLTEVVSEGDPQFDHAGISVEHEHDALAAVPTVAEAIQENS